MKKRWLKKLTSSVSNAQSGAWFGMIALSLTAMEAHAFDKTFPIQVRHEKKLAIEERLLTELSNPEAFEGKYFKITRGSSPEAIRFDDADTKTVLRAATVYYHLSTTRDYFDTLSLHDKTGLRQQMVIRVEQEDDYSEVFHFDPRASTKKYNASKIIPPSDADMKAEFLTGVDGKPVLGFDGSPQKVDAWGYELWFRKAQTEKRKSPLNMLSQTINTRDFKNMMMGNLLYGDMVSMTQNLVSGYFDPVNHLISMSFSIGLSELIPQALGMVGKMFKQRYYLDSALIPEIVIHEFSHIALSPVFGLKQSTALNEGFANYFAYKVTNLKKLGARARKHNLSDRPKSALNRAKYSFDQEMTKQAAYGSFTFGLLYDLDEALGTEGEKILTRALFYLKPESTPREGLTDAVKKAIQDLGTNPRAQWMAAQAVFLKRGL